MPPHREIREEVSHYLGPDWEGFRFGRDGQLYVPEWRRGFTPQEIRSMFFRVQHAAAVEAGLRQAQRDLERVQAQLEEMERLAAWYRRQLVAESRFGMMLAQIGA